MAGESQIAAAKTWVTRIDAIDLGRAGLKQGENENGYMAGLTAVFGFRLKTTLSERVSVGLPRKQAIQPTRLD
jgi:hypothetical protein